MTKLVSLSDEAYSVLSGVKEKGESFSKLVMRLMNAERDVMSLAGAWSKKPESRKVFSEIAAERRSFRFRETSR